MRILQVCSYLYPALTYGGPAKMVYDLSTELSKDHTVTVYTTDVWDAESRITENHKIKPSKNLTVTYFPNIINALAYKIRFFTGFGMIFSFIKNSRSFDIVHIHDVFIIPQLCIAVLCILTKKPYIMSPHGVLDPTRMQKKTLLKSILLPIALFCLSNAQQVIAVSDKEATDLRHFSLSNVITVYNGIPRLSVKSTNKFSKLKSKHFTLLYIGKLHPQKGLLETLKALHNSNLKYTFLIAGPDDGALQNLQKFKKQKQLSNVHFLGYVGDAEKKELYDMSDVFVHPSLAEGFSISILEAMQEGLPVIISDGCNFTEVSLHQAGYTARTSHLVEDLSTIFDELEKKELKILAHNAAELIKKRYTVAHMAQEMVKIYKTYV